MPTDTRQRLIDCARRRFYRDGFRNVGLSAILSEVGISKTAFYKHFASKDELVVAVLDDQSRWLERAMLDLVRQRAGRPARDQLDAILDVVGEIIERPDFHGCIFVNAAMEFPKGSDPAHRAAQRNKEAIECLIHDLAERAGAAHPQVLAEELCLIIEGCYVTRSVTERPQTIAIARRLAQRLFSAELPDTAADEGR